MLNKFNDESRQFSPSGIWWSSFFAALSVLLPSAPFMQGMTVVRPLIVAGILFFCAILIFFASREKTQNQQWSLPVDNLVSTKFIIVSLIGYVLWMLCSGYWSSGKEYSAFQYSQRGLVYLMPMVFVAWLASRHKKAVECVLSLVGVITLIVYYQNIAAEGFAMRAILLCLSCFFIALLATKSIKPELWLIGLVGLASILKFNQILEGFPVDLNFYGIKVGNLVIYQETTMYIGFSAIFFLLKFYHHRKKNSLVQSMFLGLFLFALLSVFDSAARSAMVALSAIVLLSLYGQPSRTKVSIILTLIATLCIYQWFFPSTGIYRIVQIKDDLTYQVSEQLLSLNSIAVDGVDSSLRIFLYTSVVQQWLGSIESIVFGNGLASFPVYIGKALELGWYPHNFILETLSEGGLIGAFFLLIVLLSVIVRFFKEQKTGSYLMYTAIYVLCVYMFIGGIQVIHFILFTPLCFLFAIFNRVNT